MSFTSCFAYLDPILFLDEPSYRLASMFIKNRSMKKTKEKSENTVEANKNENITFHVFFISSYNWFPISYY